MKSLAVIIGNPAARMYSEKKIEFASSFLSDKGLKTETVLTLRRGEAESYARTYSGRGAALIVAAGGDGTINEIINGIAYSETALAILPLGTTNVLARELSITKNIEDALKRAVSAGHRTVSLGSIILSGRPSSPKHFFCLMAGIGFDAGTVRDVNSSLKKISGRAAYVYSGIKKMISYCPDEISLNVDGREYSGYSAIIGKSGRYGGDFMATPDARLETPSLYTCIFRGRKRIDLVRYAAGVLRGTHIKYKDVEYIKSSKIIITGNAPVQVDGDYIGATPAFIQIEKNSLRIAC